VGPTYQHPREERRRLGLAQQEGGRGKRLGRRSNKREREEKKKGKKEKEFPRIKYCG
jgi:hypothetical protein